MLYPLSKKELLFFYYKYAIIDYIFLYLLCYCFEKLKLKQKQTFILAKLFEHLNIYFQRDKVVILQERITNKLHI